MVSRAQRFRFRPVLFTRRTTGHERFRLGRRLIYWTLAVVIAIDLLLLLGPEGAAFPWRAKARSDIVQQMSVTIKEVDPVTRTIRVAGDLVGIMGADVLVTPETFIGIDRQLARFGQLRDGLRANISFVRQGQRRVARWIQITSQSGGDSSAEPAPSPGTAAPPR